MVVIGFSALDIYDSYEKPENNIFFKSYFKVQKKKFGNYLIFEKMAASDRLKRLSVA
jgi:hypothetical protein